MKFRFLIGTVVMSMIALVPRVALAQPEKPAAGSSPVPSSIVVEVTIARYQGDKRISSFPYTVAVTADNRVSNLRVGGQIPIPSTTLTPATATSEAKVGQSYSYRDIGTSIDITAAPVEDGRYRVLLSVEESSVYPASEAVKNNISTVPAPSFRSLRSNNAVILRDGQTVEYVAATDRVTGETARIGVKLTVLK
jgi:type II secretory pathway component GspD/PulD (secretin)